MEQMGESESLGHPAEPKKIRKRKPKLRRARISGQKAVIDVIDSTARRTNGNWQKDRWTLLVPFSVQPSIG
jgi:hypothetical protein